MADAAPMIGAPASTLPSDDAALLAALRAARTDEEKDAAFEAMVRARIDRLLPVARRILGNEDDARDAVQDAFVSAFRSLDRFAGGSTLSTWLHRITVNASLMRLRSRRRKRERAIEDLLPAFREDGHPAFTVADWRSAPDDAARRSEVRSIVRKSIDALPEAYRTVLLLRDIEGLDTEETARIMEISPGAVKTRLHRARLALRTLLDPYMQQESV